MLKKCCPWLCFLLFIVTAVHGQTAPVLKWKFKAEDAFIASPVLDDGIIYCAALDHNLYAIDLQTGNEKWRFTTAAPNRSTVLIHENCLYFYAGEGILYCLDKKTAKVIWSFKTGGEKKYTLFSFADHFQSSPVWDNGYIYIGSGKGNVYAIDALTGKLFWKYQSGDVVHTTPAVSGNKLLFGSFDGYFYALDKMTGKLDWKFKSVGQRFFPRGEFPGSPAVSGNTVYTGSRDFNLYAINISTGHCNWNRYFTRGWSIATPVFYNNMVINGTADDRLLVAMDTANGAVIWRANARFIIFGSCLISDSTGYFGTLNGNLLSVNLNSGALGWSYATEGNKINHDRYITKDEELNDSTLNILNADLSKQVGISYQMGGIYSKPCISGKLLVFSSSDGYIYCVKLT